MANDPITLQLRLRLAGLIICALIAAYYITTQSDAGPKEVQHEAVH